MDYFHNPIIIQSINWDNQKMSIWSSQSDIFELLLAFLNLIGHPVEDRPATSSCDTELLKDTSADKSLFSLSTNPLGEKKQEEDLTNKRC